MKAEAGEVFEAQYAAGPRLDLGDRAGDLEGANPVSVAGARLGT